MKRKNFFRGLALGTLSLPFLIRGFGGKNMAQTKASPSDSMSTQRYKWKMVTTWPPNFPVLGEGCVLFAEWVKKMSGGRLEIEVYGGGELVPALDCFDAVRNGVAECSSGAADYWAGKSAATQFFATVPFGMNAQQLNAWLYSGGGQELYEELYAPFGLIPMSGGNTGVQMGGWYNREINSLADFQGLKMRMPGLGGKVLAKAGGTAVLLPGGELYTGLERGVIDALEWIGPYHDYKMGFHQIAKYYYTPGWHEPGTSLELLFNKEKFEALPEDLQEILRTAAYRLNIWTLSEFEARNAEYLKILIEKENVEVRSFPKPVMDQLRNYTKEILEELAESDPVSKKIYAAYQEFRGAAKEWSSLTEQAYPLRPLEFLPLFFHESSTMTALQVVIHHAHGLHKGVSRSGADEGPASLF